MFMLKIAPEVLPTETAVYNYSRYGEVKRGNGEYYKVLKQDNEKHIEDALIGEVAIKNNITLVTNDTGLIKKVNRLGGKAISVRDLCKVII